MSNRFDTLMAAILSPCKEGPRDAQVEEKRCKECQNWFVLSDFYATGINEHTFARCKQCTTKQKAARRVAHPEKYIASRKKENAKRYLNQTLAEREENRQWKRDNAVLVRAYVAKATAKYKLENPEEYAAKQGEKEMRRHAAKLQQTPAWSDPKACRVAYRLRISLQKSTGIRQAVDHSVPLRGKLVCGFHVPENLVVIPFAKNASKGNRFDPMTYEWWPECCPKPTQRVTVSTL